MSDDGSLASKDQGQAGTPVPRSGRGRPAGRTSVGETRRDEVVKAAYRLIAERGFEGFRTRQVAEETGINVATLHYYFPTKEALVQGVVDYLLASFGSTMPGEGEAPTAVEALRFEFDDLIRRLRESPDQFIVLTEISSRAARDPAIAAILGRMGAAWHTHLSGILSRGVSEGVFRADLDIDLTARSIMVQLRGLGSQGKVDTLGPLVNLIADQILTYVKA